LERQCLQVCERQRFQGMTTYQQQTVAVASSREMYRMAGGARLDALIDYSGYDRTWTRAFAHADMNARRIIYLHSDMQKERVARFWNLASTFEFYRHYDALVSVSAPSMMANRESLSETYGIDRGQFVYADNVFDAEEIKQRATEL